MNKKTINRVNGGIAIYYGIGSAIAAIAVAVGIGIWMFKVFSDSGNFSWGVLALLVILTVIMGIVGYILLRVGYGQIEK